MDYPGFGHGSRQFRLAWPACHRNELMDENDLEDYLLRSFRMNYVLENDFEDYVLRSFGRIIGLVIITRLLTRLYYHGFIMASFWEVICYVNHHYFQQ